MNLTAKGSALPRGLSCSDRIYMAPCFGEDAAWVQVAVRRAPGTVFLYRSLRKEAENWAAFEKDHRERIETLLARTDADAVRSRLPGDGGPAIMGIVNVTPDSFSDGGDFLDPDRAFAQASRLVEQGATILDIGGESTRPGAKPVPIAEEIARVVPVIEKCAGLGSLLSIDTRKPEVMQAAIAAGAGLINDVTALEYSEESLKVVVESGLPVCLMHSSADPRVMQDNPQYDHALFDVIDYLEHRVRKAVSAGVERDRILVDPGIGFGKTLEHNMLLMKGLAFLHGIGCPVLLGVSRKSFIGLADRPGEAKDRLGGSLAAALYGMQAGAQIYRVHDVAETRQALAVWQAIENSFLTA
ncbi:dihydropteroate synthase [Sneathiella chinensis]|uniref:dihydropteroate synthase n=1 Tax=Sneathiella chinensis TaxID=349750 RepID=A0ABQ5U2N1_9PROT|nr:dihydropteroate synthase [Sneathiella chinensis]GLQ06337.1 hypothetical protein GCM10007924_15580 [Sneathiella chinensis]